MDEPSKFYVNIPWPTHSYEQFQPCIIEATIQHGPYGDHFVVTAPPEFGRLTARVDEFGGWIETEGPARLLSIDEHLVAIIMATKLSPDPAKFVA